MDNSNPWYNIPFTDYELHIEHQDVRQAKLLNHLTGKYLTKHKPENILFSGISSGNGLEHVDVEKVKSVCAIDIQALALRIYPISRLICLGSFNFEYVDMEKCLEFIRKKYCSVCQADHHDPV